MLVGTIDNNNTTGNRGTYNNVHVHCIASGKHVRVMYTPIKPHFYIENWGLQG